LYRPAGEAKVMRAVVPSPGMPRVVGGSQGAPNAATLAAVRGVVEDEQLPDGVHVRPGGEVLVKAGDAYLRARNFGGEWRYAFGYFTLGEREWEHGYLTQGVRRLLAEEEFAREVGLTEEQRGKLKALPEPPAAKWSEVDREKLAGLHRAWDRATGEEKARAEQAMVEGLRTYAEGRRAAEREVMERRVEGIKGVLNGGQLEKVNPIRKWK
jgi:hypothetical protein